MSARKLAVVTGASSGIGYELARCAAEEGCDVIMAADESEIRAAAATLEGQEGEVVAVEADLGTEHGVAELWDAIGDRHLDYFAANAGRGLGHAFLEQDWDAIEAVRGAEGAGSE